MALFLFLTKVHGDVSIARGTGARLVRQYSIKAVIDARYVIRLKGYFMTIIMRQGCLEVGFVIDAMY